MRKIEVTRVFNELYQSDKVTIVLRGGARSSKSFSVAQYIIWRLTNEPNCKILITRKTMPSLRLTAYKTVVDLLKDYGYYSYCDHSFTNNYITYKPNGSFIAFLSLDNPERIKSTEWNVIHIEEAYEFQYEDYMILKTRLSAPTKLQNKLILSFNPVSIFSWIKTKVVDKEDHKEIVSTYKDNPFLSQDYIDILESTKIDHSYWKIYGLGLWGSLSGLIFDKWQYIKEIPQHYTNKDAVYGIDWGFTHPTAIVKVVKDDNKLFIQEKLYKDKLTNTDVIASAGKLLPSGSRLIADNAEPQRIEEFRRAGFSIRPCVKGPSSVKDSIDFVKRHDIYITEDSVNLIKEIESYKWRESKDGKLIDEPLPINDDAIAALRYAAYSGFGKKMDLQFVTSGD